MSDRELSLKAAAKLRGLKEGNVYARRKEGLITTHPGRDRRTKHLVYLAEFDDEVGALQCRGPGCTKRASNAGEFCDHACSVRQYPVERLECPRCHESFELDGYRARDEGRRFCPPCQPHVTEWRWEHERESFPQAEIRGELWTCPTCGRKREYRPPSHLEHEHCEHCVGKARSATWKSEAAAPLRAATSERSRKYWDDVYREAARRRDEVGGLLTADVCNKAGGVSVPTVTRYYSEDRDWLTKSAFRIRGQTFALYTEPQEIKKLQTRRAMGPAWNTWLDYDWRLARARERGDLQRLGDRALTAEAAEKAIRKDLGSARKMLGAYRGAASGHLAPASGKHRQRDLSSKQKTRILELHAGGGRSSSVRAIARVVGVPKGRVERFLAGEKLSR